MLSSPNLPARGDVVRFAARTSSERTTFVMSIPKGWWTMLNLNSLRRGTRFSLLALITMFMLSSSLLLAQTTLSTASIVDAVTDPTGALAINAKLVLTNAPTDQTLNL